MKNACCRRNHPQRRGKIIADRREANGAGRIELADSMFNEDEAREIAAAWARTLRKALDKAHGIGK